MATRNPVARKLTVYSAARQELAVFEENYGSIVVDCSTPKGITSAKDCRKEIRDARCNLEDLRKETKAPFIAKGTQVDDEAKAIKAKLDTLFNKFDGAIKAIENKKAIDAAKAVTEAAAKVKDLEDREAAIIAKEIELGIREPEPEAADEDGEQEEPEGESASDSTGSGDNRSNRGKSSGTTTPVVDETVICQPHIDLSNTRLEALRKISELIKPTDPQPEGEIDEAIARVHDEVLAEVWEIVDELL